MPPSSQNVPVSAAASASASASSTCSSTAHATTATTTTTHGEPPEGLECLVTMEDITSENYVEYQCHPSLAWLPAKMEQGVIEELLRTQFHAYVERVKKTDCQAELKRLLASGPPVYVADPLGLPLLMPQPQQQHCDGHCGEKRGEVAANNDDTFAAHTATATTITIADTHIVKLWFASDNQERSAKLDGAVEGDERDQLWHELKQFIVLDETDATDEKDEASAAAAAGDDMEGAFAVVQSVFGEGESMN